MFGVVVIIILNAGAAYAIYACIDGRREARAYGQHMHTAFLARSASSAPRQAQAADFDFGVTPAPDGDNHGWQPEAPGPTTLDLLYEQMAEQEEGFRRREREREREQGY